MSKMHKCPTCASHVKVTGTTTMSYEPIENGALIRIARAAKEYQKWSKGNSTPEKLEWETSLELREALEVVYGVTE